MNIIPVESHSRTKRDNPLISIIIPVYNVGPFLPKCLDSILSQTYENFEAVLVDDGSTDHCGAILDDYAARDRRIVVVHKQNEGTGKARFQAFEKSRGELISFVDSDDYIAPEYLEALARPIIEDGADMVSCERCVIDGDRRIHIKPHEGVYEGEALRNFIDGNFYYDERYRSGLPIFLWGRMVRRELVGNSLRLGIGWRCFNDAPCFVDMLYRCRKLVLLPASFYYYVQHGGQITRKFGPWHWDALVNFFEVCERLDVDGLASGKRRIREWLYLWCRLFVMLPEIPFEREEYCSLLSYLRNMDYMCRFFTPWFLHYGGLHHQILYLMLKLRLYDAVYLQVIRIRKAKGIGI